ncbi:MAG: hypothetical protein FWE73_03855 [Candidatus Bathyarchaeota archaeon]|nr:hypothetical protein [Candidatus Termitimicrobium sp.]
MQINCQSFKPVRFLIIISLTLIIALSMITVPPRANAQTSEQSYERSFTWDYEGQHWTWNLSIPTALYESYQGVPVSVRTKNGPAGYGYLTTTQDYYVKLLAQKLTDITTQTGYNDYDKVSFVLTFVQNLRYASDIVTTGYDEYPRFPIETLVDEGGDCEDTAILFATLARIMGYGVVYINPPNHYAVGILGNNLKGTHWVYPPDSNQTYYYCETTGVNFKIGQLPQEFNGQTVKIYPIDETKQFIPAITVTAPTIQPSPTQTTIPQTFNPNPTTIDPPVIPDPITQPVLPLSLDLITENSGLFVIIIATIATLMTITILSTKTKRTKPTPQTSNHSTPSGEQQQTENNQSIEKFCVFCGAINKGYASFCEKCGKQLT